MYVFPAVAAAILFLLGAKVIDTNTQQWFWVALGFWALHFSVDIFLPIGNRRNSQP